MGIPDGGGAPAQGMPEVNFNDDLKRGAFLVDTKHVNKKDVLYHEVAIPFSELGKLNLPGTGLIRKILEKVGLLSSTLDEKELMMQEKIKACTQALTRNIQQFNELKDLKYDAASGARKDFATTKNEKIKSVVEEWIEISKNTDKLISNTKNKRLNRTDVVKNLKTEKNELNAKIKEMRYMLSENETKKQLNDLQKELKTLSKEKNLTEANKDRVTALKDKFSNIKTYANTNDWGSQGIRANSLENQAIEVLDKIDLREARKALTLQVGNNVKLVKDFKKFEGGYFTNAKAQDHVRDLLKDPNEGSWDMDLNRFHAARNIKVNGQTWQANEGEDLSSQLAEKLGISKAQMKFLGKCLNQQLSSDITPSVRAFTNFQMQDMRFYQDTADRRFNVVQKGNDLIVKVSDVYTVDEAYDPEVARNDTHFIVGIREIRIPRGSLPSDRELENLEEIKDLLPGMIVNDSYSKTLKIDQTEDIQDQKDTALADLLLEAENRNWNL